MTIPSLLFAFLIGLFYGSLYHLIRGGSFWRLLLYLILSAVGFFAGHFIGLWRGWIFAMVGQLNLGSASLGSVVFLVVGDWLSRIEVRRETEVSSSPIKFWECGMELVKYLLDLFLHLDEYLASIISQYGTWTYALLFFVIFMETGFVVTPFLPGDSLLFAAGTFAGLGSLNVWLLAFLLMAAAILGDTVNYWIGHYLGDRAYSIKWIKKEYLDKTHTFFEKHGGKTIFLARFVPIVRTFAPFVAGIGRMSYGYFITYNFVGGIVWVALFTFAGYFFGNIPFVKRNFEFVIIAIILISVVPMFWEALKARRERKQAEAEA